MKILLTVHDNSIAPRFDQTAEVIIAEHDGHGLTAEPRTIILPYKSVEALSELIVNEGVQCVVCGGIEDGCHNFFTWKKITVIDGVIGAHAEALRQLLNGELRPGTILPSAKEAP
jgi:predicted Fe-Mo cluster-binding NifX family protein